MKIVKSATFEATVTYMLQACKPLIARFNRAR